MIKQFLYLVGKKILKFWNHLPSLAKIPAARTDHLLCADTNDLGEISAPRVRINNTLVGGILDFRSVKYIIEYIIGTRRANQQLVGLRFQWKHEAPESVPKIQKRGKTAYRPWKCGAWLLCIVYYSVYVQLYTKVNMRLIRKIAARLFHKRCSKLSKT